MKILGLPSTIGVKQSHASAAKMKGRAKPGDLAVQKKLRRLLLHVLLQAFDSGAQQDETRGSYLLLGATVLTGYSWTPFVYYLPCLRFQTDIGFSDLQLSAGSRISCRHLTNA
ncbi:hypothetical protein MRB53_032826 [Persea americana]|uniref:Uncharacterized protein n=1 Tax=Persea americana TaxID=3435 RepID=A0ACC2KSU6_PERAE|nr:hypothetical protein MRB53_032826 [Persea americana]